MPLTVITLKNVPPSLKGDLSKWMQEIAVGVYIGNFNSRVRERIWERVVQNVNVGEATLSFACRNEIGYSFKTFNTEREIVDFEGIPLVILLNDEETNQTHAEIKNFSNARKFRNAHKFSSKTQYNDAAKPYYSNYVAIDIETDGLSIDSSSIIEIGAVKFNGKNLARLSLLIKYNKKLPEEIIKLTGITEEMLINNGVSLNEAMISFKNFISDYDLVGFNVNFDIKFINKALISINQNKLKNKTYDLMRLIKKEKMFLSDYKLSTCLREYGLPCTIPHRAVQDAELIYQLSTKVNEFLKTRS